ncbi:hypothetical protein [Chitinophaga sp. Cy-1792]|uniref:hypothetical protein n=1 Tax=Chitinophaga sp. Cy-1792 TaxID=2608339 RepID=UPI0014210C3D|nr:hypothetical protein [Chitinophaga sp. Cy-1792]NIG54049.1 hypothetical protein [Chitinophaga sp. Cy-1792]
MTLRIFLLFALVFGMASCDSNRPEKVPPPQTPQALEDKGKSSYEILSKRGPDDLIESIYMELAEKDSTLARLEEGMKDLNSSKDDSTASFRGYDDKIAAYYQYAARTMSEMKDTVLRDKLKVMMADSEKHYKTFSARHHSLMDTITRNEDRISDLYIMVKVVKTLPVIEKYQRDKLPGTKQLEGFIHAQRRVINLEDSLVNK